MARLESDVNGFLDLMRGETMPAEIDVRPEIIMVYNRASAGLDLDAGVLEMRKGD